MRPVTYSMGASLDGFIVGPDGRFDWSEPDPAVFQSSIEEVRSVDVHLLGRRLYETMLYWQDADASQFDAAETEWARLWNAIPKVVFSRTLTEVRGNARLGAGLVEEIERLRAEPGDGEIAIGGADLAAQAISRDLIDEYRVRVYPLLVGGGAPFFARDAIERRLELIENRTFECGVIYLRYRVVRN